MIVCVLSLTTSICVMYLNARADNVPVIAMPAWVSVWVDMVTVKGGRCCSTRARTIFRPHNYNNDNYPDLVTEC